MCWVLLPSCIAVVFVRSFVLTFGVHIHMFVFVCACGEIKPTVCILLYLFTNTHTGMAASAFTDTQDLCRS